MRVQKNRGGWWLGLALLSAGWLTACGDRAENTAGQAASQAAKPVQLVVYTSRKEHLIKPLFDAFTAETGIAVTYLTDEAGPLLARLRAEGENSPADVLMTVDAGNLWQAADAGVLVPLQSPVLEQAVPPSLRDAQGRWFALTLRARTVVYSTERVQPAELSTYEALAEPQWRGRLCLRSAAKVYNQSLVATMIAAQGEEQAEQVVRGWVDNLALPPLADDVKVMEAILAGQCDVGIVNTYYFGGLQSQQPQLPLALFWPNQQGEGAAGRGVHVNVSGAGLTRASKHPLEAQRLLEWLASAESQQQLMALNLEYPVRTDVAPNEQMQGWGSFRADSIPVSESGRLQADAVRLMDRAGYQ